MLATNKLYLDNDDDGNHICPTLVYYHCHVSVVKLAFFSQAQSQKAAGMAVGA